MIGKTDIKLDGKPISKIALGSWQIRMGDLETSFSLLDAFFDGGGNVFDTARCYGLAENVLGKWIKSRGIREEVILITKGCNPNMDTDDELLMRINEKDLEKDLTESLSALDLDYIDIYFLHKDDPSVPVEKIIEMLNKYVKSGVIRHLGASNWSVERINQANAYAKEKGLKGFEFSEISFSLRNNTTYPWGKKELIVEMDKKEYDGYAKNQIPVFGFTSQASGFFYRDVRDSDSELNKLLHARLRQVARKNNITPMQALFGCYFGSDIVSIPLVSARCVEHINEIIENCGVVLSKEDVNFLLEERLK